MKKEQIKKIRDNFFDWLTLQVDCQEEYNTTTMYFCKYLQSLETEQRVCEKCGEYFKPIDKLNYHCQKCQPCNPIETEEESEMTENWNFITINYADISGWNDVSLAKKIKFFVKVIENNHYDENFSKTDKLYACDLIRKLIEDHQ